MVLVQIASTVAIIARIITTVLTTLDTKYREKFTEDDDGWEVKRERSTRLKHFEKGEIEYILNKEIKTQDTIFLIET
jgi:hypothetical protein